MSELPLSTEVRVSDACPPRSGFCTGNQPRHTTSHPSLFHSQPQSLRRMRSGREGEWTSSHHEDSNGIGCSVLHVRKVNFLQSERISSFDLHNPIN
ncbi:hypothetical protein BLNAU_15697 [Blattamonas nauphoetae]|uniref:Uncharacterized protein n=1 Tax=Blattamonas nauphoetae TaxID=2049346 RepID=A0ABQ9X8P5_9EUKA|nr:hypothetical protein BLNAU_16735 [Blattamonas nauphoetae]KAK2949401.1 hypothetical protein BLNAU_15697 [Blattamonas nauphoetae]